MGVRGHVCKVHDIQHGSGLFKYQAEEIHDFLVERNVQIFTGTEEGNYYTPWEIDRESFRNCLKQLEAIEDKSTVLFEVDDDRYTAQELIDDLSIWEREADPNDQDYIHIDWF